MACPRSLSDGCASATSLVVADVDSVLQAVECFMGEIGARVESFAYSRTCCVSHPDGLACRCKMEVFLLLPSGRRAWFLGGARGSEEASVVELTKATSMARLS